MKQVIIFSSLLSSVVAHDKNLMDDDHSSSGESIHDYDTHGCDLAKGEYYCAIKSKCVSTWDACEDFYGYNDQCIGKWSGLTWDLSPLKDKTFTITDTFESGPSYAYAFGICGNANLDQSALTPELISKCDSTSGAAGEIFTNPAPVYQVYNDNSCERAGEDQSGSTKERFQRGNQMEWALLDPLNPAMGIELTYKGGNTCKQTNYQDSSQCEYIGNDGKTYCERGMRIRMTCNPNVEYIPVVNSVSEDASCMYELRINSKYACPTNCAMGQNGKVCSGNGLCMFHGYSDTDSTEKGTATASCACGSTATYTDDCGTYSRWGSTYTDTYNYLSVYTYFWRKIWSLMFILIVAVIMIVNRKRLAPIYTGIHNLITGESSTSSNNIHYQMVDDKSGQKNGFGGGGSTLQSAATKYSMLDLEEEEDDDDVGSMSAQL